MVVGTLYYSTYISRHGSATGAHPAKFPSGGALPGTLMGRATLELNAAERSRTSTGVSTHKALKLKSRRLLERISRSRAKSNPAIAGCFR
jgi:hypothetical protein